MQLRYNTSYRKEFNCPPRYGVSGRMLQETTFNLKPSTLNLNLNLKPAPCGLANGRRETLDVKRQTGDLRPATFKPLPQPKPQPQP